MSGIIINIPPIIPTPPINATSTIMPVKDVDTFIDSNIKNVVNQYIATINDLNDEIGLKLDFFNNIYSLGKLTGLSISLDTNNNELSINGDILSTPVVAPEKMMKIIHNGDVYFLQLYIEL
jgi:hypothetical protein